MVLGYLLLPAAGAQGAVVQLLHDGGPSPPLADLVVTALPGESNRIAVAPAEGGVLVRDDGAALIPGEHCAGGGAQVTCSGMAAGTELQLYVSGSDGDDRIAIEGPLRYRYSSLSGGNGDDVIVGGPRDDDISGSRGNDQLDGAAGDDDLTGDQGADSIRGGPGTDSASWRAQEAPVTVTLDDRPDDGGPGEGDNAGSDVENLIGGSGPNRLVGSEGPNRLEGGRSSNELLGGGGNDRLVATEGRGGILSGGPGRDRIEANAESSVDVRDGEVDRVECFLGLRRAPRTDAIDKLERCVPEVRMRGTRAVVSDAGRFELQFLCAAIARSCHARVRVTDGAARGDPLLARATVELDPGRVRATFRLNRLGRELLKRRGTLTVYVRAQAFEGRSEAFPYDAFIVLRRG